MAEDPAKKRFLTAVINPGGTSTKVACFEGEKEIFSQDIRHEPEELKQFESVYDQLDWRMEKTRECFLQHGVSPASLDAVIGRGGPVAPVPGGTFAVDEAMLAAIREQRVMVVHPSLLGAPMAHKLAAEGGCPAYIADPVSVDEFVEEARLTGLPEIPRRALSHALSVKATALKAAAEMGRPLEELNLVVVHLGSGTTVAAQKNGRQVDSTDASASGPMAPTRAGNLPALDLVRLCFSGKYNQKELQKLLVGSGGWTAHLKTDDLRVIYKQIDEGDQKARLVLDATLLQIAKEIAAMAVSLGGKPDAIVLTGGVTRSERFVAELKERVAWISERVFVFSGDDEMNALASAAMRTLETTRKTGAGPRSMAPYIEKFKLVEKN